ncbi:hypothetical protein GCM10009801_54440 [Streptomyces albiaxialis]|uniref:Uncharacterized protein n=1 Tax=Streptomyces albiaxialis TaxID=329523 RepID=A0ABN2WDB8_9ACTN
MNGWFSADMAKPSFTFSFPSPDLESDPQEVTVRATAVANTTADVLFLMLIAAFLAVGR